MKVWKTKEQKNIPRKCSWIMSMENTKNIIKCNANK